jgi:microcystin-dependent protein
MATPYLGEIRLVTFNFAPRGWALCNGQLLPINQNQALFALLGTFYGGNGTTNFALPNLQGRVPVHMAEDFELGQSGGEQTHTLVVDEMPAHTHTPVAASNAADRRSPVNHTWAGTHGNDAYATAANASMNSAVIEVAGGGEAHQNMQPYLTLSFVIALTGIFPTRN